MKTEDIMALATLSRISIREDEATSLRDDIEQVLSYVSAVSEIAGTEGVTKTPGALVNVFRADEVTNQPGAYTETLLDAAPERRGRYVAVKKILDADQDHS